MIKNNLISFLFFIGLLTQAMAQQVSKDSLLKKLDEIRDYNKTFQYVKSIREGNRLLERSKKANMDSISAEIYYTLGSGYESVGKFGKALENYRGALNIAKSRKDSVFTLIIYNGLGNVSVLKNKDYKKSNAYYRHALKLSRKVQPSLNVAFITNLCWNFVEEKKPEKVNPFIPELKEYLKNTRPDDFNKANFLSKINQVLGQYYSAKKNYAQAEPHFDEAIRIACKYDFWENLKDSYKFRGESWVAQGKYEKAYADIEEGYFYKEKYLNAKAKDQLAIQKSSLQLKKNEKALHDAKRANALSDEIAHNRKIVIYIGAVVTLVLIVFLIIIYRGNQAKKRLIALLNKRNTELILIKKEAEKATELKNQFISNISHEIRTPLHGVTGTTALLLDNAEISKENRSLLRSLKFSGDYLLSLINNVLFMTKIDTQKIKVTPKNTTVPILIESLKNTTRFLASKNFCEVNFRVDDALPSVICTDRDLLSEILINLIENAIKFSKNGKVNVDFKLISKTPDNLKIRFVVQDSGPGIPEDKRELIFEKFSQILEGQNEMKGTGLGLSIVKNLLEILGSKILMESEIGKGSTFYFDLDCMLSTKTNELSNSEMDLKKFKGKRILLIEDNEINTLVIKKFLKPLDLELLDVSDGKIGFDLLMNDHFDLALIDINIPSMNGYEISQLVREQGINIPIIAVTASEPDEIEEKVKKSGMNGFLIKPFNKEKLYQILESYLS